VLKETLADIGPGSARQECAPMRLFGQRALILLLAKTLWLINGKHEFHFARNRAAAIEEFKK